MTPADLLARFDALAAAIETLRADVELLLAEKPVAADEADQDSQADFVDSNLLDTVAAASRFGLPSDQVRRWCREGAGVKRGGRWLASVPRFRRRLRG